MMKMLLLFILWMMLIERWSSWWWWLWFFVWKKLVDVVYARDKPTTITCVLAHEKEPIVNIVFVVMLKLVIIDNVSSHEVPIVVVPMLKDSPKKIYDAQFWNEIFDVELPKYINQLKDIFGWQPLEVVNANITSKNVFNNL